MSKDFRYLELFETYENLLTARQAEIFRGYYGLDLSLAEIAEENGTTRQSVSDALKKVRGELDALEQKLGMLSKRKAVLQVAGEMKKSPETASYAAQLERIFGD